VLCERGVKYSLLDKNQVLSNSQLNAATSLGIPFSRLRVGVG
jgi:hypothetical protein